MTVVHYTIPPTLSSGQYNLTIETDYRNHVFEFNRDNNNLRWKVITIIEEHPDLSIVSSIQLHTSAEGNRLAVNYTVLNTGIGPTFGSTWRDVIVITNVQTGSITRLRSDIHSGLLLPSGNYTNQLNMNLQQGIVGNYVLRIQTDVDQRITEENENNNIFISRLAIPAVYADLFAFNVTVDVQEMVVAGNELELTWFVRNIGNGVTSGYWNDAVYIDTVPSLSPSGIRLSTVIINRFLMPNQEYQQTLNVTIPITLSGNHYIFVLLDEDMQVYENSYTQNNIISFPLLVVSPPSPDLVVSSITYSQTQTESDQRILTVSWRVTNNGNSMGRLSSWRDAVFLSKTATFNESESINIGYSDIRDQTLVSNQQYTTSVAAVLNMDVSGYHYIFVVTDSSGELLELNGEYNNARIYSNAVDIIPPPLPSLQINLDSNYPTSLTSSNSLTVQYNITNIGERSISLSSWTDRIYLSTQGGLDREMILENGIFLGEIINNRDLEIDDVYSVSTVVTLPYGINRYVYLIVVVDINGNLGEPIVIGDMQILHAVSSHSFLVENGPLPDLTISPLLTSTQYRSGEPTVLQFQVTNLGENAASGVWYDTLFLSQNVALDEVDNRLITIRNNGSLERQASYNQTVTVFIPYSVLSGEYYLFIETDVGGALLETNENNNIASVLINIQATATTDLILDQVSTSRTDLQYGEGKWSNRNLR